MNTAVMESISPELRKRVLTGVAGIAVLLLLVIYGSWLGVFLISAVLSLAMTYEFSIMIYTLTDHEEKRYVLLFTAWFIALGTLALAHSEYELLVFAFLGLFSYFLVTARRHPENLGLHFKELMFSVFAVLYLALLPSYLPRIHGVPSGIHWTVVFFLINWATDTGAYFSGKKFGKLKLYPLISPGKTREGSYGAIAVSFAVTLIYKLIFFRAMPWGAVIIVPPVVSVFAQLGDLCESLLKRAFDVKDSGSILPGHGGFLDRFDGVVFSLPIMYACIRIFA
jgi:phosphatidate cytidylyltransferase